jgi:flagellar biosynthesis chaperone FliJ
MAKYRFRLETVLRARRVQETQRRSALAAANRALVESLRVCDMALASYTEHSRHEAVDVRSLCAERFDIEVAALRMLEAERDANRKASEAALAHVEWSQAARGVAVLERLDARRREEHAIEENRKDVRMVDDLVTARYAREIEKG